MKGALLAIAIVGGLAAEAAACPRDAVLAGDDALVTELGELLRRRGIDGAADDDTCPTVRARVERRGGGYVVAVRAADGEQIERVVGELATAATVNESFTRTDVAAPLLAVRERPAPEPRSPASTERPPVAEPALGTALRGVQIFGALETSVA